MSNHNVIVPSKPKIILEEEFKGVYEIDGLYPGYGHTLGNSLRRVLLSSLEGAEGSGRARVGGSSGTAQALNGVTVQFSSSPATAAPTWPAASKAWSADRAQGRIHKDSISGIARALARAAPACDRRLARLRGFLARGCGVARSAPARAMAGAHVPRRRLEVPAGRRAAFQPPTRVTAP